MRTMVTGGAGFIGSNLVDRLLAEGHAVDVVDDLSTGSLANLAGARANPAHEMTFHQLDIRSGELVEMIARRRPEVIFHLAAQADVRVSVNRPVFDADVNILGTLRVLEGARALDSARVVFAASGGTLYGEIDPADLQWALSAQCQRMGLEVGDQDAGRSRPDTLQCPFCEHVAVGSEMHTDETVEYLRRLVYREYIRPKINKTFAATAKIAGHRR